MPLAKPDPSYTHSRQAATSFRLAMRLALMFVALVWAIHLVDGLFSLGLNRFGLRPGFIPGLSGLVTAPLLHGSIDHLLSNTVPLVISLTAILYFYPYSSVRVIPLIWILSGAMAWVIGRPSLHYGASGLVYGLLVFLFVSGMLRRDMRSISVSLLVGFLYGSMIWGVLPIRPNMSWELHLCGAISGLLMALLYRQRDRIPVVTYDWEDDDAVPEWYPEEDSENAETHARFRGEDRP